VPTATDPFDAPVPNETYAQEGEEGGGEMEQDQQDPVDEGNTRR